MKSNDPESPFRLEFDPRLVEKTVLLGIRGEPAEGEFHQARSSIYELDDEEERDARFDQFHQQWFLRLNRDQTLLQALLEQPLLMGETRGCRVVLAIFRKMEGADLYGDRRRRIVLRLRPDSLLNNSTLLAFLRHEFMHLVDMLDPRFGYQSELPQSDAGPSHDNLMRRRYRVLWDTWIDGRLARRGWAGPEVRARHLKEFRATFPMLEETIETSFSDWFDKPFHAHRELVAFAQCPEAAGPARGNLLTQSGKCPLCRFPSVHVQGAVDLSPQAVQEIRRDFPEWDLDQEICRQCFDLYQSRRLSQSAQAALPG